MRLCTSVLVAEKEVGQPPIGYLVCDVPFQRTLTLDVGIPVTSVLTN